MITQGQTIPTIFNLQIFHYQHKFSHKASQSSFQSPQLEKRLIDFEKNMERFMKNQESLIQTVQNNHI